MDLESFPLSGQAAQRSGAATGPRRPVMAKLLELRDLYRIPLWLLASFILGNVLASVFQLAHCLAGADFVEARPGQDMEAEWARHQVTTTVDFARRNRLLSWYLGGLNFQVEHHLFPRVCHVHYPALSRIVEETCADHDVVYRAEPTLLRALAANVRWLRTMGRPTTA